MNAGSLQPAFLAPYISTRTGAFMQPDDAALTAWVETLGAHALQLYGVLLVALLGCAAGLWALARRYTVPTDTSTLPPGAYLLIRLALGFAIVVGAAAIFAEAAEVLGTSADARRAGELDQVFSNAVRRGIGPAAFQFFSTVTRLADTATLTVLAIGGALALLFTGRRWLALAFAGAIGGNALLNTTLKGIFERARPLHDQAEELARGFSFPSGHSSGAVVAYGMLAYVLIRCLGPAHAARLKLPLVLAATALAFTIGCSRVFIQVHFATDVLAGFASGSAWLAVCIGSAEWLRHYRRSRVES
jgi:membrane-associated phospholipid phosphatase